MIYKKITIIHFLNGGFSMNWYDAHYLCKNCKGCEAVANGESECLVDTEYTYDEEEY